MSEALLEEQQEQEVTSNPYNMKKAWHTPDGPRRPKEIHCITKMKMNNLVSRLPDKRPLLMKKPLTTRLIIRKGTTT